MSEFIRNLVAEVAEINIDGVSDVVVNAMGIIIILLFVVSIFALAVSVFLAIAYAKYNRRKNSCGKTGEQVARAILDNHGLENIKVSKTGSIIYGNSYSHYFKKVRLRRLTWKKDSVTSLSMAAQKSSLAVLDKEGNPDMKKRVTLAPIIGFGPLAFIPLIIIGAVLDLYVFKNPNGTAMIISTVIGLVIYLFSFILSLLVLKTEKKAQKKALEIMKAEKLATAEELEMSKKLFKLYNIEYVNDMVIALLELIYRVLQIISYVQSSNSSSASK